MIVFVYLKGIYEGFILGELWLGIIWLGGRRRESDLFRDRRGIFVLFVEVVVFFGFIE